MSKQRHTKSNPSVRCCWICGKEGGNGFTSALRWLGYDVPMQGCVAHAHAKCIAREQEKAKCRK
jgi:hypothetical protein